MQENSKKERNENSHGVMQTEKYHTFLISIREKLSEREM